MKINDEDKRKIEEFKKIDRDLSNALMQMWSIHNQEVQELRQLYFEATQRIAELEMMVEKSRPTR